MNQRIITLLLLIIMVMAACKKQDDTKSLAVEIGEIKSHQISLEQATKIAILSSIYPEPLKKPSKTIGKTSSSTILANQRVNPSKTIKNTFTYKKDQANPALYIVNYQEGGFVMVSGDDRVTPILAYSNENNFPIEKMNELPRGLIGWFEQKNKTIKAIRENGKEQTAFVKIAWKDMELKSQLSSGSKNVLVTFPECLEEGQQFWDQTMIGPLSGAEWDQGLGYNNSIPTSEPHDIITGPYSCYSNYSNGRPPVGCVATAIAQAMYYYKFPTSYNWSSMYAEPNHNATLAATTSVLMKDIGEEVNMSYGCSGSSAWLTSVDNAFTNMGYASADYAYYSGGVVLNELWEHRVVVLGGDSGSSGHAWIAEGVQIDILYVCHLGDGPIEGRGLPPEPSSYWTEQAGYNTKFYLNWGWSGDANAWYNMDDFTPNSYDFDSGLRMITDISPY
jgi:hypothetical protein